MAPGVLEPAGFQASWGRFGAVPVLFHVWLCIFGQKAVSASLQDVGAGSWKGGVCDQAVEAAGGR